MRGFDRPWWIAGGWAIELFVSRKLRDHEDIELGLLREDQFRLREHLRDWQWCKAVTINDAGAWVEWRADEKIELPLFQLKADRGGEEIEFMLNDPEHGHLLCRRNHTIALPLERAICRTCDGIPYLAPEMQLLYKAKHHREKDEADFGDAIEVMSDEQRRWLKNGLTAWNAGDPWIARL
jgi:hypothetical protein